MNNMNIVEDHQNTYTKDRFIPGARYFRSSVSTYFLYIIQSKYSGLPRCNRATDEAESQDCSTNGVLKHTSAQSALTIFTHQFPCVSWDISSATGAIYVQTDVPSAEANTPTTIIASWRTSTSTLRSAVKTMQEAAVFSSSRVNSLTIKLIAL